MATFHTVFNFVYYYNVGCQALSHDRRLREFSFETVIPESSTNKMKHRFIKTADAKVQALNDLMHCGSQRLIDWRFREGH